MLETVTAFITEVIKQKREPVPAFVLLNDINKNTSNRIQISQIMSTNINFDHYQTTLPVKLLPVSRHRCMKLTSNYCLQPF